MRHFAIGKVRTNNKEVYLTFDDGPDPGITDFVLEQLDRYGFKGTFFCKGLCAETYPELVSRIVSKGHAIGNHTYSHIKSYDIKNRDYVKDVFSAEQILKTKLFRPPNGCLTLCAWLALRKKFTLVYWSLGSCDWCMDEKGWSHGEELIRTIKNGDIILFHFSEELSRGTKRLLPLYLEWLHKNGFVPKSLAEI